MRWSRPRGRAAIGIACQANEQVLFHIHAHLTIFAGGRARSVPAGIGIAPPYDVVQTRGGPFVAGASCFMWLHTHAADGIIHTESPVKRTYTLSDFFDIWGQPLDRERVGPKFSSTWADRSSHPSRSPSRPGSELP